MVLAILPLVVLSFLAGTDAAPYHHSSSLYRRYDGPIAEDSYIVTLHPGVDKDALLSMEPHIAAGVTHAEWDSTVVNGFAGKFNATQLDWLLGSPLVESVTEDGLFETQAVQTGAPWGLSRLSSNTPGSSGSTYRWLDEFPGDGVDIYVVDTGININHVQFAINRASYGWSASGTAADDSGHGTYVAAIAIGTTWGVAKQAKAIAVKVYTGGTSTTATIISGLNYVATTAPATGRPSIALFPSSGSVSTVIDNAVIALANSGIPVVTAAGNSNVNASNISPARVAQAIVVGASTITDARASFSNYGPTLDYFAPGSNIPSAWHTSTTANMTLSGTSSAAAHVAGLIALYFDQYGTGGTAGGLWHVDGILTGIPTGTINRLALGPIQV